MKKYILYIFLLGVLISSCQTKYITCGTLGKDFSSNIDNEQLNEDIMLAFSKSDFNAHLVEEASVFFAAIEYQNNQSIIELYSSMPNSSTTYLEAERALHQMIRDSSVLSIIEKEQIITLSLLCSISTSKDLLNPTYKTYKKAKKQLPSKYFDKNISHLNICSLIAQGDEGCKLRTGGYLLDNIPPSQPQEPLVPMQVDIQTISQDSVLIKNP